MPSDRGRLLVVDDHPTNRLVLTRLAGTLGWAADSAADGGEGLALWQRGRHVLVLADCNMPVMDGYEMTREIRRAEAATPGGRATVVVAFTAPDDPGVAERCAAAGMDDCLYKPATPAALQALLARWLPA